MKKITKLILPLAFVLLLIAPTMGRADYNVTVGNTFTYDVVASNWDLSSGTNTSTGTGFEFNELLYPVATQFDVEVIAETTADVDYEMSIGTETDTGNNWGLDALGVLFSLIAPAFLTMGMEHSWNATEIALGPGIQTLFFVDPVEFSELFFELSNESFVASLSETNFIFTNVGGNFDNSSSVAVFEWHFDTTMTDVSVDITGTYVWQFAYDKVTGVMQGYYTEMDYSGTVNSYTIAYYLEQRVELEGYDLPGAGGFIPGFEW
ncbi:MAG: choice-of-anchor S family protein, partial [Candidatus Heimdallarchaeota archaeon]